jgi:hypothetical protein
MSAGAEIRIVHGKRLGKSRPLCWRCGGPAIRGRLLCDQHSRALDRLAEEFRAHEGPPNALESTSVCDPSGSSVRDTGTVAA